MKTKEEILAEITGIPLYRIKVDDNGEYITKKGALEAMEEYRSQCNELPSDGITRFTEEEIKASKTIRDSLIGRKGVDDFKKLYMAGEVVMSSELNPIIAQLKEENERLREGLLQAVENIKVWNGDDDVWDIYYNNAPEMKIIRNILPNHP